LSPSFDNDDADDNHGDVDDESKKMDSADFDRDADNDSDNDLA